MQQVIERNQDATLYVGNLDDQCSEAILWELFTQAGPVVNVHMPKDRVTGSHQGYGFVEFAGEEDADYAMKVMNMVKLFGKHLRANKVLAQKKNDIGANLFIGNIDPEVDEKLLFDTFSAFGNILRAPKIVRDSTRAYAFINYGSFEASDAAIEAMNGQFLSNRPITVCYAFKKDSKGERHGDTVERLLAKRSAIAEQPTLKQQQTPASGLTPGVQPILLTNPLPAPAVPLVQAVPNVLTQTTIPFLPQPMIANPLLVVPPPPTPPPPPSPPSPPPPPSPPAE